MAHTVRLPHDNGSVAVTPGFISKDSHFTHRFTVSLLMDWDTTPLIFDFVSFDGARFVAKSEAYSEFKSIVIDVNSEDSDSMVHSFAVSLANHISR